MIEHAGLTDASKKKIFPKGNEEYYYVFFLGTDEKARGKGLCSAIVRHYQEIARKDNMPIYMAAGTESAWRLY